MALLGLLVPASVSDALLKVKCPGDKDPADHITMFYFEQNLTMKDIVKICKAVSAVIERHKSLKLSVNQISCFPKGPDGVPIKGDVESKELLSLREALVKKFNKDKIVFSKTHAGFHPHVTVSYSKKEIDNINLKKPITWTADKLILWGGSDSENGINVEIPLGGKISKAHIIYAIANKFSKNLIK